MELSIHDSKILIVEPDSRVMEMLVESLAMRFEAGLTCTASAEQALDVEMFEPHHLVIADMDLPGMSGLDLARHMRGLSRRPIILTGAEPDIEEILQALRVPVMDFLPKPYDMCEMLEAVEKALVHEHSRRNRKKRYQKSCKQVKSFHKQRQELEDRIELVCRDLVGAHRRLVNRVMQYEQGEPGGA